jgi:hypothetical protein
MAGCQGKKSFTPSRKAARVKNQREDLDAKKPKSLRVAPWRPGSYFAAELGGKENGGTGHTPKSGNRNP